MIVFCGTKKVGVQSFMIFKNETESVVEIPVQEQIQSLFLHYFHRLSPGIKPIEEESLEDSKEK